MKKFFANHYALQRKWEQRADTFKRIFRTPSAKLGGILFTVIVLLCLFAPVVAPYNPTAMDLAHIYERPSLVHLCGTDSLGRDIFSRLLYGGRYSIALALTADLLGQAIGVVLGSLAGYFGKNIEMIIMRLCDIWSAIPGMLLSIILSSTFGPGFFNTVLALSIGRVPQGTRMCRGQILAEKSNEYLEAAVSINCRSSKIIFSHLLPNVISPTIVTVTMGFGRTITTAAGLSYLGLGVQPPTPEWGAMLSEGVSIFLQYPHAIFFPGLIIGLMVFAVNLMGDGLRDALDPKLRD